MMKSRKAIVTGAYGAIGKAIAKGVAQEGYELVVIGRNKDELQKTTLDLIRETNNNSITWQVVDLSRKEEIKAFADHYTGPLDVLINNAAATPKQRMETPEGIEMQFATNVLGYVWMTEFLTRYMENTEDARIVNVASYWAGDLMMDDLEFTQRSYNNDTAYRQSKQANRMLTAFYAKKLAGMGISVLAAHPGDVNSKLSNNLGYGGWESPDQGAATPLYCALDPSLKGVTGKYFENMQIMKCRFSEDMNQLEKLFDICMQY